jgi:hypothetical protein
MCRSATRPVRGSPIGRSRGAHRCHLSPFATRAARSSSASLDIIRGGRKAWLRTRLVQICQQLIDKIAPRALVVDLSDLSYRWGDEMECIYRIDPKLPQATVVSEKNRDALSTLEFGMQTKRDITELDDVVDSVDAALMCVSNLKTDA